MKRKLPLILLVISLAFNAFFIGGFFWAKDKMAKARSREGRARMIAEKLDLDDAQNKVFEDLLARYMKLREEKGPRREAFWTEMLKDEPDRQKLVDFMVGEEADNHRLEMLTLIEKFIGSLRAEQREKFVEMVKKRSSSK